MPKSRLTSGPRSRSRRPPPIRSISSAARGSTISPRGQSAARAARSGTRALLAGLALATLAGCGDAGPPAPNLGPPLIELVYQGTSAERPLEQVFLHGALGDYGNATNLLQEQLLPSKKVELAGFTPGTYYLTVVRKQLSLPVSDLIALTTADPVALYSGRFVIWVFDESFRVYDPVSNL